MSNWQLWLNSRATVKLEAESMTFPPFLLLLLFNRILSHLPSLFSHSRTSHHLNPSHPPQQQHGILFLLAIEILGKEIRLIGTLISKMEDEIRDLLRKACPLPPPPRTNIDKMIIGERVGKAEEEKNALDHVRLIDARMVIDLTGQLYHRYLIHHHRRLYYPYPLNNHQDGWTIPQ